VFTSLVAFGTHLGVFKKQFNGKCHLTEHPWGIGCGCHGDQRMLVALDRSPSRLPGWSRLFSSFPFFFLFFLFFILSVGVLFYFIVNC
jgi:hypothetical protein